MANMMRATIYIPERLYIDAQEYADRVGSTVTGMVKDHIVAVVMRDCGTMVDMELPCRCRHHLFGMKEEL